MSSEDVSRKEKLALAKQKVQLVVQLSHICFELKIVFFFQLKSYQQRQKVEKRLTGPPEESDERQFGVNPLTASSESLAESSVSSPPACYSDHQTTDDWTRPKSTGFIHDEHRSPFQRVQRASESAEVEIFPAAAEEDAQGSTPRASSRPPFDDPPQNGVSFQYYTETNGPTAQYPTEGS